MAAQISKLRERFVLKEVALVGDCGMLAQARIEQELRPVPVLEWITALHTGQVWTYPGLVDSLGLDCIAGFLDFSKLSVRLNLSDLFIPRERRIPDNFNLTNNSRKAGATSNATKP